jgi:hypothetical protein
VQIGSSVRQRDERAAQRKPAGGLSGRVPAADHGDPLGAAQLGLRWPGGVKDADPLVLVEILDGQPTVLRAGSSGTTRAAIS